MKYVAMLLVAGCPVVEDPEEDTGSSQVEEGDSASEPATVCTCRAGDEVADLLCVEDPSAGPTCDVDGFSGSDGEACTGFGPRSIIESWCDCYDPDYGFLCPEMFVFQPSQSCPSEGGLNGFHGATGDTCTGYTAENESRSGRMQTCSTATADTVFQSLGGTLEGCYETSAR